MPKKKTSGILRDLTNQVFIGINRNDKGEFVLEKLFLDEHGDFASKEKIVSTRDRSLITEEFRILGGRILMGVMSDEDK